MCFALLIGRGFTLTVVFDYMQKVSVKKGKKNNILHLSLPGTLRSHSPGVEKKMSQLFIISDFVINYQFLGYEPIVFSS